MPGWPIPVTVVPASGLPHIVTADPDGAAELQADHVHGMMWNPMTLVASLQDWLGGRSGMRLGIDALSPGGRALIEAAIPGAEIVDATRLLAGVLLCKSPDEVDALANLCQFVTAAAEKGLQGGRVALLEALDGAFPISHPLASERRVRRGSAGWPDRRGPFGTRPPGARRRGGPFVAAGSWRGEIAAALPSGVEVVGLGR